MVNRNKLKFVQINLHHCKAATDLCNNQILKNFSDIALITEPYQKKNKVKCLQNDQILYGTNGNNVPRSCIMFRKNMHFTPLTQFCSSDVTVASINVAMNDTSSKIILCSAYFDINKNIPNEVQEVITYCKTNNLQLILGCDTNAHSLL